MPSKSPLHPDFLSSFIRKNLLVDATQTCFSWPAFALTSGHNASTSAEPSIKLTESQQILDALDVEVQGSRNAWKFVDSSLSVRPYRMTESDSLATKTQPDRIGVHQLCLK